MNSQFLRRNKCLGVPVVLMIAYLREPSASAGEKSYEEIR